MMLQKEWAEACAARELKSLALELDVNKSGSITHEELVELAKDPRVRRQLQLLDVDIADVDMFYQLLCNLIGAPELNLDLFVAGCMKMKGAASSADMQALLFQTRMLQSDVDSLCSILKVKREPRSRPSPSVGAAPHDE